MSHTTNSNESGPPAAGVPWAQGSSAHILPSTVITAPERDGPQLTGESASGWTQRPEQEVDSSWLRQISLIDVDGTVVRLQACLDEPAFAGVAGNQGTLDPTDWPLAAPIIVIGAVRGPAAILLDEAIAHRDALAERLETHGVGVVRARTVDRIHAWTEPALIAVPGHPDGSRVPDWQERALEHALALGVTTVVRIINGAWQVLRVLPESARFSVIASAPCSITRDDEHRCPMQAAPEAGQYCSMRGGPWTSRSISAAADWLDHRDRLVAATRCDTCEGVRYQLAGRIHARGGPVSLVTVAMPTRWLASDARRARTRPTLAKEQQP